MKMKKISVLLLAVMMLLTFTACNNENEVKPATEEQVEALSVYVKSFDHKAAVIDIANLLVNEFYTTKQDDDLIDDLENDGLELLDGCAWDENGDEIKFVSKADKHVIDGRSGVRIFTLRGNTEGDTTQAIILG